jgi:hypothetical protein
MQAYCVAYKLSAHAGFHGIWMEHLVKTTVLEGPLVTGEAGALMHAKKVQFTPLSVGCQMIMHMVACHD